MSRMIGRAIRKGEQFGRKSCWATLSHHGDQHPEDERGRVYDNVKNVHRIRPKAEPKQEKAEQPGGRGRV